MSTNNENGEGGEFVLSVLRGVDKKILMSRFLRLVLQWLVRLMRVPGLGRRVSLSLARSVPSAGPCLGAMSVLVVAFQAFGREINLCIVKPPFRWLMVHPGSVCLPVYLSVGLVSLSAHFIVKPM